MAGFRPVVELYMAEFMLVAMDQVVNEAPRFRYMSGGQVKVPLVLKAGFGFAAGWAGQHTGSLTALCSFSSAASTPSRSVFTASVYVRKPPAK